MAIKIPQFRPPWPVLKYLPPKPPIDALQPLTRPFVSADMLHLTRFNQAMANGATSFGPYFKLCHQVTPKHVKNTKRVLIHLNNRPDEANYYEHFLRYNAVFKQRLNFFHLKLDETLVRKRELQDKLRLVQQAVKTAEKQHSAPITWAHVHQHTPKNTPIQPAANSCQGAFPTSRVFFPLQSVYLFGVKYPLGQIIEQQHRAAKVFKAQRQLQIAEAHYAQATDKVNLAMSKIEKYLGLTQSVKRALRKRVQQYESMHVIHKKKEKKKFSKLNLLGLK
jgi:hypothetical protein